MWKLLPPSLQLARLLPLKVLAMANTHHALQPWCRQHPACAGRQQFIQPQPTPTPNQAVLIYYVCVCICSHINRPHQLLTSLSVRGCCFVLNRFQSSTGCWNRRVRPAGTTDTSWPPSPPACSDDRQKRAQHAWSTRVDRKDAGRATAANQPSCSKN